MRKRVFMVLLVGLMSLSMSAACSLPAATNSNEQVSSDAAANNNNNNRADNNQNSASEAVEATVAEPVEHNENHYDPDAYSWDDADVIQITLNGSSITADGEGVAVDGSTATITAAGTYSISGTLADGQIIVDTEDEDVVRLILNGIDISSSTSSPIFISSAKEAVIVLADGTTNQVSDGTSYVFEDAEEDEPNAAIFSKSDLIIYGNGSLSVAGNYNDGIASKDGLIIASGQITINAVDDGIRGKDYLIVQDGTIAVNAQGDGLKSDYEEDVEKGYIAIESGVFNITAGGDAIQAQADIGITAGEFTITSGGGSGNYVDETSSAKGIKGAINVTIDGGTFTINSADDGVHSNGSIVINDGTFVIASSDDGMHADATLDINNGNINITESYEGLESAIITINDGEIHLVASDDGINVAGGNDGSGMMGPGGGGMPGGGGRGGGPGGGGGQMQDGSQTMDGTQTTDAGQMPGGGGGMPPGGGQMQDAGQMPDAAGQTTDAGQMPGGGGMMQGFGQDGFATGDYYLYINGGHITVDAGGDGIDTNGSAEMTGGVVLVNGPTNNGNGPLDYMGSFQITGGILVAVGSSGMSQSLSDTSTQYSMLLNFDTAQAGGTLIHIETSSGEEILTFQPTKQYQSLVFSSPELANGQTYNVYYGGSSTGTVNDGLYEGGAYTPGTQYTDFTISSVVTRIGGGGGFR